MNQLEACIFVRETPEAMEEVYPLLMAPDIEAFYKEWLGLPVPKKGK